MSGFMISSVLIVLALGKRISASNDAVNVVDSEVNTYHHLVHRRWLRKRESDKIDADSTLSPCIDTPDYKNFLGNDCKWFEENDKLGCPLYGSLWNVNEHCCYCKSSSANETIESAANLKYSNFPSISPSGNPLETGVVMIPTPTTLTTDHPSESPVLLTQSPTFYSSENPSGTPTDEFLPGEVLVENKKLGISLSAGLEANLIASTGKKVEFANGKKSSLPFHSRIDGAGVIDLGDRGYVYVSNSEEKVGGVFGLQFSVNGDILDYKNLLNSTRRNCGGGLTPWNTWISCEEWKRGQCWQVAADPRHPTYLMAQKTRIGGSGGRFESVATDNRIQEYPVFFVTEDSKFGAMRRFQAKSTGFQSLHEEGDMSFLRIIDDRSFEWTKNLTLARESANTHYQNSEGINFNNGILFFTAKSTQKLFMLNLDTMTYRLETTGFNFKGRGSFNASPDQVIKGNADSRYLYFTESGGWTPGIYVRDTKTEKYMTLFEATDKRYFDDETVGIAFSPDRTRMYAGYQAAGLLLEFQRSDSLPFP